ncbi:uncharacterized protein, partial [Asterias amurensis]|uniref:uncharacterized protein n=1 Tax=Asterias amurensis TaxID=7602 RepID=UPI003AB1B980
MRGTGSHEEPRDTAVLQRDMVQSEETIPPIVAPTTWTGWFSVNDPVNGTDNETLAAVRSVYPSVCDSPTQAECRVKFAHTDHVTAGQSLNFSCTPAAGLLCQNSDQPPNKETCLDYEIRFECPTSTDTLPDPAFYWELSGKANGSDDDPVSCGGTIYSIYPTVGGLSGDVHVTPGDEPLPISADSFDSSNHLCAHRTNITSDIDFGKRPDRCITDTSCCTSGWTLTFWMRYLSLPSNLKRHVVSTGGHDVKAKGFAIYMTKKFVLQVRGDLNNKTWEMKMDNPDVFPTDVWTHHCFTYNADDGTRYYKNGVLSYSLTTETGTQTINTNPNNIIRLFSPNGVTVGRPEGDFSDFKMFYRTFNDTEVQTAYLSETSESKLVIHYLVETSADDAFDVELVCLAKSGSNPNITWYRSDDESRFYPVSPSSNIDIIESIPNIYRTRSELKVRSWTSATDATFACEALDVVGSSGSLSKTIIVSKATTTSKPTTGQPTTTQTTPPPTTVLTTKKVTTTVATTEQPTTSQPTTVQTTQQATTIQTTKKATTTIATSKQPSTSQPTSVQTTQQATTIQTTKLTTTKATTFQPTTAQTTMQQSTTQTSLADTTRATTDQPTTTDQQTTSQTTQQPTTVETTEQDTTIATTDA